MRFLKQLFSFSLVITALLLSYVTYSVVNKLQASYMQKISNDYSIFMVSATPIILEEFTKAGGIKIEKIVAVPKESIIASYKDKISPESLQLLQARLPFFYQVYFSSFPTTGEIEKIKIDLLTHQNITKVEAFSQNHDQISSLLSFSNNITMILFSIVAIAALIILKNQIKIWFYEHNEKLYIMHLHGAGLLHSASSIIKLAFISSIIATIISFGVLILLQNNAVLLFDKSLASIAVIELDYVGELITLISIGFGISCISVFGVILKHKIKSI